MKNVHIIIDSTVDLPFSLQQQLRVVPLRVLFGEEEYVDGVTITHHEFYEKLIESDVLPHTSQAAPNDFGETFQEIANKGESAVVLTLASSLSGTYQSACIAAAEYENIYVVDTESVAIGSGILAQRALQLQAEGYSAKELAMQLEQEKKQVRLVALVDTLEYLKRGGRLSKTAAVAGGLLNIKPVLALVSGQIQLLGKARGSKQGNNLLIKEIDKAGGVDFDRPVLLGYTGLSDLIINKYKEDSAPLWKHAKEDLPVTPIGSVIGTHVGPDAIAVAFFSKNEA